MTKPVEKITIGDREYTRFIRWPRLVRDGTVRCISCGQIDEEPWHDDKICGQVILTRLPHQPGKE